MFKVVAGNHEFGYEVCPTCGKSPDKTGYFQFKDYLSAREYLISGMCQTCQDDIFPDNFQKHDE